MLWSMTSLPRHCLSLPLTLWCMQLKNFLDRFTAGDFFKFGQCKCISNKNMQCLLFSIYLVVVQFYHIISYTRCTTALSNSLKKQHLYKNVLVLKIGLLERLSFCQNDQSKKAQWCKCVVWSHEHLNNFGFLIGQPIIMQRPF